MLVISASGEPPLCMAANVLFAVKAAIQAALSEIGQDNFYFPLSLHATHSVIMRFADISTFAFIPW